MKKWLTEAEESLKAAVFSTKNGGVLLQNMYMIAPIIYSERQKTQNETLLKEMIEENEKRVLNDLLLDNQSIKYYKFHFISSYLFCFVVAGKIDEFKYDKIMDYVNRKMDLFTYD